MKKLKLTFDAKQQAGSQTVSTEGVAVSSEGAHTHIHTYMHTYIQTYKHTYIHAYVHTYLYIRTQCCYTVFVYYVYISVQSAFVRTTKSTL
jgi:hypothetical protein